MKPNSFITPFRYSTYVARSHMLIFDMNVKDIVRQLDLLTWMTMKIQLIPNFIETLKSKKVIHTELSQNYDRHLSYKQLNR